jgi:hypothetical protein
MKSGDRVSAVILQSGDVVEFDDEGGTINSYRGTIDGTTMRGKAVSIKIDNVKSVRLGGTNNGDPGAWTALVGGAVIAVAAFVLYYAYHVLRYY